MRAERPFKVNRCAHLHYTSLLVSSFHVLSNIEYHAVNVDRVRKVRTKMTVCMYNRHNLKYGLNTIKKEEAATVRRLLQYCQLPDKNFRYMSRDS